MKQTKWLLILAWIGVGCGSSDNPITYDDLVTEGWALFEGALYDSAATKFSEAAELEPFRTEAYNGIGWARLRKDRLTESITAFETGNAGEQEPSATLYAGWAFALNAQKQYVGSNTEAAQALTLDPEWVFEHGLSYNKNHLHVLKAGNFFAIGDFASSLAAVKLVNAGFNASVTTSQGQAALAAEIERLKGTI